MKLIRGATLRYRRTKMLPLALSCASSTHCAKLASTFQTPWKSNALFGVLVALFAGLVPGHIIGEMTSIGTLLAFVIVCVSVPVLRRSMPQAERPFRVPLVPWIPIAGALSCIGIMASLPLDTWLRLIIWLLIGCVVYFFYSRHNSRLGLA